MTDRLPTDVYVVIEGEPFLSRAQEYRRLKIEAKEAWWTWARSIGATQIFGLHHPTNLVFPRGKVPADWKRPNRKGRTNPKKGTQAEREMMSLPPLPRSRDVYGDAIVEDIRCHDPKNPENRSVAAISHFFEPFVGWLGDTMIGMIPHAGNAAVNAAAEDPDWVVEPPAPGWVVPEGLRMISKAEYDLMVAMHNFEAEKRKEAEKAAT